MKSLFKRYVMSVMCENTNDRISTFQKPSDLPLNFLLASDLALCGPFGQFRELFFQSCDKAVQDCILLLLPSKRAAENEGLLSSRAELYLNPRPSLLPVLIQKMLLKLLEQGLRRTDQISCP